jgi:hypothetical protein
MQLLQDTFIIEQLQVLSEGKDNGKMKIKGVFGRCNEKNNNGRIYPTAVLESQLAKVQPMIAERRLCGELDHPQNDTVKLSNASHLITKLDMKGNELIGEAEILNTPAGLTAAALVNGGVKIGISSRGMGTLSENETGDKIVNEDFRLVTFDLVADPSTRGAYPGLSESTQSQFVRETQDKLSKEDNFLTMLESRMRKAYKPFIEENKEEKLNKTKSKKKSKKNLPGNQEAIDADGDGKIEASDLAQLRKESMDLVRKDGHWHRLAGMVAEALGYELSEDYGKGYPKMGIEPGTPAARKEAKKRKKKVNEDLASNILAQKPEDKGIGIAASERRRGLRGHQRKQLKDIRKHTKKMGRIETKEAVRRTKKMGKAEGQAGLAKAKFGAKSAVVTGRGEGSAAAARKEGEAVGSAKIRGRAERAAGRQKAMTTAQKSVIAAPGKARDTIKKFAGKAKDAVVDRSRDNTPLRGNTKGKQVSNPVEKNPVEKNPTSKKGDFGDSSKVNPNLRNRAASLKQSGKNVAENPAIAGPKGKLPGKRKDDWTSYKQIGLVLAEALGWTITEAQALHTQSKDQAATSQATFARKQAATSPSKKYGAGQSKDQAATASKKMTADQVNTGRKL